MGRMKLGTKISLGFGLLILIALSLGGLAVVQMSSVSGNADKLALEYVPEVKVANEVERNSLLTMYAMRGYALSEEEAYLTEARKQLEAVNKSLDDAGDLADKAIHLVKLKGQVNAAAGAVKDYSGLAEQTVNRSQAIAQNRDEMNRAAALYIQNCAAFLEGQNEALTREIREFVDAGKLEERHLKISLVNDIIDLGNEVRIAAWRSQALRDPKIIQDVMRNFEAMDAKFLELRAITRQAVNIKQIDDTKAAAGAYKKGMTDLLANWLALQDLNQKRGEAADRVLEAAQVTSRAGIENTEEIANDASSALSTASTIMIGGLIIALAVGAFLSFFITRSITKPINRIIEALASGADQVSSASGQVSSASQSLAEGASEQAAAIEETSSSLEEMSSMTKQNADNAGQANSLMREAKAVVDKAGVSMKEMNTSMGEISSSGREIGKIIKTIDEIAFQTNLLALNAAVEAARAGEAGAGFAVVADEVRNLAQRAAEAAKNTANLIDGTIKRINQGTELVRTTDEAFTQVAVSSNKVAELIGEIAAASSEQAQGIDQVNQAVSQMDQVTQTNAANAEESASASEELNAQAESMLEVVGELMTLVGGAAASAKMQSDHRTRKPVKTRRAALPLPPARRRPEKKNGAKVVKADEVIPMDKDFDDF
ncbi:MAG: methyl-accepting chemotaxis protein [Pseudomonadota bacterium]